MTWWFLVSRSDVFIAIHEWASLKISCNWMLFAYQSIRTYKEFFGKQFTFGQNQNIDSSHLFNMYCIVHIDRDAISFRPLDCSCLKFTIRNNFEMWRIRCISMGFFFIYMIIWCVLQCSQLIHTHITHLALVGTIICSWENTLILLGDIICSQLLLYRDCGQGDANYPQSKHYYTIMPIS